MQGRSNTTLQFYGIAVDQDASPLPGAKIEYEIHAYPGDMTFDGEGKSYDISSVVVTSGDNGRFEFTAHGCILTLKSASKDGYRHFFEMNRSDVHRSVLGYRLSGWGEKALYRSDPTNPAIFVFVREGETRVAALPSVGGAHPSDKGWIANKPAWPNRPSLKDVVRKQPTTTR